MTAMEKNILNKLAGKILKTNLENLKKNEAAFLSSFSSEAIHDMRVATRRLRAAIKTFNRILPSKSKKIRVKFQKLFRVLENKRDLDVFSEFISRTLKTDPIVLAKQMDKSQKQIVSILKSKYYEKLIKSIEELKTIPAKQNVLKFSRKGIQKALNKVLKIGSSMDSKADDKILHKLRISIKKLRYICEFFEPVFSKSLRSFIEKTIKIQDILGEYQDAIVGISMLKRYKSEFSLEEFKLIKKEYELKKEKTRKSFFKNWKDYCVGAGLR